MDDVEDNPAIVIDNGSYKCKAGFSGDDAPRAVFPAVVGTPKYDPTVVGWQYKDTYVGDEARVKRDILTLRSPCEHPNDPNWDDMEKIWHHVFYNELRVEPEVHDVLVTESPLNPNRCREKTTQIMFEKFKTPKFKLCLDAVLSLYASGRVTGVVFDSGYHLSHAVPIYDGFALANEIRRLTVAGKEVTECLSRTLQQRGYQFCTSSEKQAVNDMKELLCYTALDFDAEMESYTESRDTEKSYQLPDGGSVIIRNERFRCVEALFKPSFVGKNDKGAHDLLFDSVINSDQDIIKDLFMNTILTGSSTMFPGFSERIKKQLDRLTPKGMKVKVVAPPERKSSTWIGGSISASLDSQRPEWITKEEYEESGPSIVHRKCF